MKRRTFLKQTGIALGALHVPSIPDWVMDVGSHEKLTILHTNDVHSRIEAWPQDGTRMAGLGGVTRRSALIQKIRKEEKHVLLLDAGDIWQGTPYFNIFGGRLEWELMSKMGYDAATLGNHDFDAGIEGLMKNQMYRNFPFINANYVFDDTPFAGQVEPFKIFEKGKIRIGVYGLGIELEGLVDPRQFGKTLYRNPLVIAQQTESKLKEMGCQFIICLSHLGFEYKDNKISDKFLAANTHYTYLIIGGHTHTFLESLVSVKNLKEKLCQITQVGFAGTVLGRIEVFFDQYRGNKCITCAHQTIG